VLVAAAELDGGPGISLEFNFSSSFQLLEEVPKT
jgi:hypothetical protein